MKISFDDGTLADPRRRESDHQPGRVRRQRQGFDKDLTKEVQIKPRTRLHPRQGAGRRPAHHRALPPQRQIRRHASIPQIIQRPQNRVDLIFSITEGPTTGVARINFIGNKVFDDDTLKGQIATEESAWYKFLATNDNYDPDRLTFDREQLRRFYVNHGYADFTRGQRGGAS